MNTIKINRKIYLYEGLWRKYKDSKTTDYNNNLLKWPIENKFKWQNQDIFVKKLEDVHKYLHRKNKFTKYEHGKRCIICNKLVTKGIFELNNIRWEDGFLHYINKHNILPSGKFIDVIFKFNTIDRNANNKIKLKGKFVKDSMKRYLSISRNQLLILDTLMNKGSYKQYSSITNPAIRRYSEHSGLLDFNYDGLEKIIISGMVDRIDLDDDDIYLPQDMPDILDYEYVFHTHPPTPEIGSRMTVGMLYEFPSIGDIFHFMDNYNKGNIQGSLVITPEGLYNIRKYDYDNKKIIVDEDDLYRNVVDVLEQTQLDAIYMYKDDFSIEKFYSVIAQDKKYIGRINNVLKKYKMYIDYYPRIQVDKNIWLIDTIYLPVSVVEPNR